MYIVGVSISAPFYHSMHRGCREILLYMGRGEVLSKIKAVWLFTIQKILDVHRSCRAGDNLCLCVPQTLIKWSWIDIMMYNSSWGRGDVACWNLVSIHYVYVKFMMKWFEWPYVEDPCDRSSWGHQEYCADVKAKLILRFYAWRM
jgi:hypothetical protein